MSLPHWGSSLILYTKNLDTYKKMDFGVGFLSNNVMLPILDFFYGIVPSYGFGIIALTLVVRFAVYPLSSGQIRNMRKMRITQPLMKERQEEIQRKYKDNPQKQQEEMGKLMQELGNPLAGCLPLLLQMPILFALFATLRGSPFADSNFTIDLQVFPPERIEQISLAPFSTKPQNIFIDDGVHYQVSAFLPSGNKVIVGDRVQPQFQTPDGKPFRSLLENSSHPDLQPAWKVLKGQEQVKINDDGSIETLAPGNVTLQGTLPGIASDKGFLFIDALGHVGAIDPDGTIHWDILGMVIFFGLSLYVNQQLSGAPSPSGAPDQQKTVNQITPIIFSGMFLFFPLPAGVLMYIVVANIFQTAQTFLLMQEPLPENLQKIVDAQERKNKQDEPLPFEPKKKKEKTSG